MVHTETPWLLTMLHSVLITSTPFAGTVLTVTPSRQPHATRGNHQWVFLKSDSAPQCASRWSISTAAGISWSKLQNAQTAKAGRAEESTRRLSHMLTSVTAVVVDGMTRRILSTWHALRCGSLRHFVEPVEALNDHNPTAFSIYDTIQPYTLYITLFLKNIFLSSRTPTENHQAPFRTERRWRASHKGPFTGPWNG